MRKSIFLTTILALFSLFIGLEQASAQATTPAVNKKKVGVKHSFEVAISTTEGYAGTGLFNWYVTSKVTDLLKEDVPFAAGTGNVSDTEGVFDSTNNYFSIDAAGSAYHVTDIASKASTSKKLTLTWKPEAVLKKGKYYLVLNYTEQATGASCGINNIKVLKIDPIHAFNLEVFVADENGVKKNTDPEKKFCAAKVKSATLVGNKIKYLYGQTTLYYKITASGFTGKWRPTINLPELKGITTTDGVGRKYTSIQWKQLDGSDTYKDFSSSWTAGGAKQENLIADGVASVSTESSVTAEQNSILVKIVIDNGTYEGLVKEDIEFAAKGNMTKEGSTSGTYETIVDVRDVDTEANNYNDLTEDRNDTSVLLARPTITSTSGEFITIIE